VTAKPKKGIQHLLNKEFEVEYILVYLTGFLDKPVSRTQFPEEILDKRFEDAFDGNPATIDTTTANASISSRAIACPSK